MIKDISTTIFASLMLMMGTMLVANEVRADDVVISLDDQNFDAALQNDVMVLDVYADWCGPCKRFAPIFHQVATEMKGELVFAKMNVDQAPKTSSKLGVKSIPTIILFKNGQEVKRHIGGMNADGLKEFVNS